jgi:pimeloyl-ACP methyl ester carboxylesterase
VSTERARIDGRTLCWEHRAGDGPLLVLVHGAGGNADVWRPIVRELSGFEVIAPSLPGRGGTQGDAPERAQDAASFVDALLRELGRRALVLGHSYGGAVAIELQLCSSRVEGLVLVSSGARLRVHPTILAAAENAMRDGTPMSSRFAFTREAPPEAIAAYEAASQQTPPRATRNDWRACDAFDRMHDLRAIACPVLIVAGEDDALTPLKYQRYLVDQLPRASLVAIAGAGHMLPWERPRELSAAIRAWASATPER